MAEAPPIMEITHVGMIEDAMLNALRGQTPEQLGYTLRHIESYGGELDEGLEEIVRSFPAEWVTFGGADKPEKLGPEKWRVHLKMVTMVGSRNIRGERATRQGSATEVGTYQMLRDVFDLLALQDFGLPMSRLEPGRVQTLFNTRLQQRGVSVLTQEWHTSFVARRKKAEELPWLKLGIQYFLKPGDNVADASDELVLHEEEESP